MSVDDPSRIEWILGASATGAMLAYTLLGLPVQVWRNRRRQTTADLSKLAYTLSFLAFALFTAYGAVKQDTFLILSNAPGTLLTGTILGQILFYGGARGDHGKAPDDVAPLEGPGTKEPES